MGEAVSVKVDAASPRGRSLESCSSAKVIAEHPAASPVESLSVLLPYLRMPCFLDFSGSDWCGWCQRLDAEVFSKSEFKSYARQHLACVMVDFPRQKRQSKQVKTQNAELAKKYQKEPLVPFRPKTGSEK